MLQLAEVEELHCRTSARTATVFLWRTFFLVGIDRKEALQLGGVQSVEKDMNGEREPAERWWQLDSKHYHRPERKCRERITNGLRSFTGVINNSMTWLRKTTSWKGIRLNWSCGKNISKTHHCIGQSLEMCWESVPRLKFGSRL